MEKSPAENLCTIGLDPLERSQKTGVLLWGDSHAAAWLPGFDRLHTEKKSTGMAAFKSGCPPVLGLYRPDKSRSLSCDQFNEQVLSLLQKRKDLPVVVLAARWPMATEGTRPEGGDDMQLEPVVTRTTPFPTWVTRATETRRAAMVADALDRTVAAIRATGRQVVLIKGVPEIGHSVPAALAKAAFGGTTLGTGPTVSRVEKRHRQADRIIDMVAERNDAHTLNPREMMCGDNCQIVIGDKLLYRDDDHLTAFAARQLLPALAERAPPIKELGRLLLSEQDKNNSRPPQG